MPGGEGLQATGTSAWRQLPGPFLPLSQPADVVSLPPPLTHTCVCTHTLTQSNTPHVPQRLGSTLSTIQGREHKNQGNNGGGHAPSSRYICTSIKGEVPPRDLASEPLLSLHILRDLKKPTVTAPPHTGPDLTLSLRFHNSPWKHSSLHSGPIGNAPEVE